MIPVALRLPVRTWLLVAVLLFQSHWLDDLGASDGDVAGIAVSAAGTLALVGGALGHRLLIGRACVVLGLVFVAWVSIADLIGLRADGSRPTDIVDHWRTALGWPFTVVVAATLVGTLAAAAAVVRGFSLPGQGASSRPVVRR